MKSIEAQAFWDSMMMGLTAQEYVNRGLVIQMLADIQKVNPNFESE